MIDFHTHILPEIDDGCNSVKESVVLIKMLKEQGVNNVFLTPHFYAYSSSAEKYSELRIKSLKNLIEELKKEKVEINLYLGSEVYFFEELWRIDTLPKLCLRGTEYILIELPFSEWTDTTISSVEKIVGKGYTPIIAHIERYIKFGKNMSKLYKLIEMGALLQMNCAWLNKFTTRRKAVKLIKRGLVSILGTDCHNLSDRVPDFGCACNYLKKKLTKEEFNRFMRLQKKIISSAEKVYPK